MQPRVVGIFSFKKFLLPFESTSRETGNGVTLFRACLQEPRGHALPIHSAGTGNAAHSP